MNVAIEIPDTHIDNALEAPHSRYWADEAGWDRVARTGYVVERENGDGPKRIRHEFGAAQIERALQLMVGGKTGTALTFANIITDNTDGPDGDVLLQLAALGELRYG